MVTNTLEKTIFLESVNNINESQLLKFYKKSIKKENPHHLSKKDIYII